MYNILDVGSDTDGMVNYKWFANSNESGIYLVKVKSENVEKLKKIILIK
ncbi:hypothetical protein J7L68_06890 [bacterium]|nr:hypothetical protein [bacterium]